MHRRLVVLSFLCVTGLGCPSSISGTTKPPAPDVGDPDAAVASEDCFNGEDDDRDYAIDCEDSACWSLPSCDGGGAEACDNGIDDDGDGWVDCDDGACWYAVVCEPEPDVPMPVCGDGTLEGAEECDDGNVLPDDGCDGSCRIELLEDPWGPEDEPDDPELPDEPEEPSELPPIQDVTAGARVDGGIDPLGDQDWYRIWLDEGDRLIVETSDGEDGCVIDTVVELYGATLPDPLPTSTSCEDEGRDDLQCDDDGGAGTCSLLDHAATADGFVHVRVYAFGDGETGDYSVTFTVVGDGEGPGAQGELEPNDSPEEATPLATGDVVEGEIDPAEDEDYFTFEVRAFETVRLETSDGAGGCDFDTVLTLYDVLDEPAEGSTCLDDFDAFACDDDDGEASCSMLEHFFWLDETILARVISFGRGSTGAYSLSISIQ